VLFRAGDIEDLAVKALATLDQPEKAAAIRANGRRFVEQERNWTNSIANYKSIYGKALGRVIR